MSDDPGKADTLPATLYGAEQVRALDRVAIEEIGIPGGTLMERAGAAAFRLLNRLWGHARTVTVLCGTGNNGGDGFVVARLAREAGLKVQLLQLGDPDRLQGDVRAAADAYRTAGGEMAPFDRLPERTDLIVDAVLGTGLEREVSGSWGEALAAVNRHPAPVLALDIPSGLHADTGRILGIAVRADATVTFIGLKQGLFTGEGPEQCGRIWFDDLQVPAEVYAKVDSSARRIDWRQLASRLPRRRRTAHKGDFGHVLVIGGEHGFVGAARMAAEAAARTGAGLVSVATRYEHAPLLNIGRPELMVHGIEEPQALSPLLARASVVAVGPGIGRSAWAQGLLNRALESRLPLVLDADALNLLAAEPVRRENWILTPHPGEAARLLGCDSDEIQADRLQSARRLHERYGGVVVLKGAGSVILGQPGGLPEICSDGNPGMASGGMGDLLTGIIAAFCAQGFPPAEAASMGVALHAAAADRAAQGGERGMLAGDLLAEIRSLVNPEPPAL